MKPASNLTALLLATALTTGLTAQQKDKEPPKEFTNDIGMEFVWIPPGTFMMGSPEKEEGRPKGGGLQEPQHKVTLTNGYYLGRYEVTQKQWQTVMATNPSLRKGDKLPVTDVTWRDCNEFLEKMGKKDGRSYRLPTEAEWEYACRAGTTGPYSCDRIDLADYAWFRDNAGRKIHPGGTKKPNPWRLYDMHGNVSEWCSDYYGDYPSRPVVDPINMPPSSEDTRSRIRRGGYLLQPANGLRSAARDVGYANAGNPSLGFRAVMNGPKK